MTATLVRERSNVIPMDVTERRAQTGAHSLPAPSLVDRYYDLLALPTAALDARSAELALDELALPEPERQLAVLERLHAWLALDGEDARILAASWARAVQGLASDAQALSVASERAAVLDGCSFGQFLQLSEFVPWIRAEAAAVPRADLALAG